MLSSLRSGVSPIVHMQLPEHSASVALDEPESRFVRFERVYRKPAFETLLQFSVTGRFCYRKPLPEILSSIFGASQLLEMIHCPDEYKESPGDQKSSTSTAANSTSERQSFSRNGSMASRLRTNISSEDLKLAISSETCISRGKLIRLLSTHITTDSAPLI